MKLSEYIINYSRNENILIIVKTYQERDFVRTILLEKIQAIYILQQKNFSDINFYRNRIRLLNDNIRIFIEKDNDDIFTRVRGYTLDKLFYTTTIRAETLEYLGMCFRNNERFIKRLEV